MSENHFSLGSSASVDLEKIAQFVNIFLPVMMLLFAVLGFLVSFSFHFLTVILFFLNGVNFHYLHIQKDHSLLSNFGLVAQLRYVIESVGPEFRQYLFMSDTEEKPFNRIARSEVYRKAKGVDSSSAFGSQLNFDAGEIKLRHSMFPLAKSEQQPFSVVFGEERGIANTYTLKVPILISAMSYGALGENAVRALARGAKKAGLAMNTGEGGYPKYHLMEGCDLIFQMGTAKFGVRSEGGLLDDEKLREVAKLPQIKMIEIKLSQGAKPGKGGLLPKEKITKEISELRGVPMGQDVISPASHVECKTAADTVAFITRVQAVSELPVGIKLCVGRVTELNALLLEMKTQNSFPDYISIDGAEGGTGAAPKSFMDDFGMPIMTAFPLVQERLVSLEIRDKVKLMCAGKLISPAKQFVAYSMGANAVYTARGFMLALGCIQALQCNNNTCPVGITTHHPHLQKGLDIEVKSERVFNYVQSLMHDYEEMLSALGKRCVAELDTENLYLKEVY